MARSSLTLQLLLLVACCFVAGASAARPSPSSKDAGDGASSFVRTWCAGTEYPALCDVTLAPYAETVGTSPARLAWAALTVTLGGARNASSAMRSMAARGHLSPVAAEAAGDCVSMLGDGVDALRRSVDAMARVGEQEGRRVEARKVRFEVDNVRTWASAALTDDNMCMEGFKGEAAGGGGAREAVRGHVMGLVHLTANALGIVNAMSKQTPP
ncbi:hypothetical protein E2562_010683 [Oryza meyeriana var. granulata]|uniref:Pectinesterase inhibitor domain-containing protein n=1 Tax=Oryza meyeriana var. granulata TaxID=110450 RepID=A0A6G1EW23_9ORYZ|nr:hypothetical protein E2562_010683 [Oryza meyeriana var. granulata]